MDLELKGKTALVTGSTRGIGKAISMVLSNEGANLAIVGRSRDRLNRSAKDIFAKTGTKVFKVVADTGEDESVENMIDSVATNFGKIDILVNCAATPLSQVPVVTGEHFNNQLFLDDMERTNLRDINNNPVLGLRQLHSIFRALTSPLCPDSG